MKTSYRSFAVFFLLFSFSILFVSCSQESGITSPNESQATTMAKNGCIATGSINHSTDTVISFPKSKKEVVLPKGFPADKIKLMDDYMATHNISVKTQVVQRNTLSCGTYITNNFVTTNYFEPAYNKYIGICTDYLSYYKCHSYGFNQYFVGNNQDAVQFSNAIQTAIDSGFSASNIMADLGNSPTFADNYLSGSPKNIGYYYIDEPFERITYGPVQIQDLCSALASKYSGGAIEVTSYTPANTVADIYHAYDWYTRILNSSSNIYIQCDEYYGNCAGHTYQYWNLYKQCYSSKNKSNWMHVVINNGNGNASSCGYAATSWQTLITTANNLGINNIWLYAYQTGNENAVINFSISAWETGWMYRFQNMITTVWLCNTNNPCANCVSPNGNWYIDEMYSYGGQWISY